MFKTPVISEQIQSYLRVYCVTKIKLQVTIFSFSNESCFFTVYLCLHLKSLYSRYTWFNFNVPLHAFKLNCFKFVINNFTCHKAIVIFKVASNVFKIQAYRNFRTITFLFANCNFSIFLIFLEYLNC